ncbi:hypothetical protein V5O84_22260 [Escherichia coli]|uniref:Uncharacterized protein n=2 Tax=Escherichia coli TaxID=562 RepID=A0AAW5Z835_ECOLX|nr:hypothetical protein [Escherichia coli]MCH7453483.1 hypothetical protein [Escherichia coli]MCT9734113.1 hypothetical protein [Escherichia coli]MDA4145499.1 hypothetical protein [Escherichia coli]MDA4178372.1 hypothetical protein [Escherichia coli]MDK6518695.1 hypothetical protein [Escherichia coli]
MIIFFFPFLMDENDLFLESEVEFQNKKGNKCYGIRASDKTPLHFLKNQDTLYVVAHGNTSVIGTGSKTGPTLTPRQLAILLLERRLPKNFVDIRILSCHSGIHSKTPAFAQQLKEIMVDYGYKSLIVTGYLGEIDISRDWRLRNIDTIDFYATHKKGIIPHESYLNEQKKILCNSELKFSLSDFKKKF